MYAFQKLKEWGDAHYKRWMDVLRILFGFTLHLKGLYFISITWYVMKAIPYSLSADRTAVAVHIIAFLHILLGTLILIGVGTRVASLILIPVILTSVFFANPHLNNLFQLAYSIVTLGLCVFYFLEGDGVFSVRQYMLHNKER